MGQYRACAGISSEWSYVTASPSHRDPSITILSPLLFYACLPSLHSFSKNFCVTCLASFFVSLLKVVKDSIPSIPYIIPYPLIVSLTPLFPCTHHNVNCVCGNLLKSDVAGFVTMLVMSMPIQLLNCSFTRNIRYGDFSSLKSLSIDCCISDLHTHLCPHHNV